MSLMLFLIPAAIGGALTGYYGDFDVEKLTQHDNDNYVRYATQMKNEDIIKEALHQYGLSYEKEDNLNANIEGNEVIFLKNDDGNFDLVFNNEFARESIENFANDLFDYYKTIVQERTYQNVMDYIKKEELDYKEEITNDSDVILTLTLD